MIFQTKIWCWRNDSALKACISLSRPNLLQSIRHRSLNSNLLYMWEKHFACHVTLIRVVSWGRIHWCSTALITLFQRRRFSFLALFYQKVSYSYYYKDNDEFPQHFAGLQECEQPHWTVGFCSIRIEIDRWWLPESPTWLDLCVLLELLFAFKEIMKIRHELRIHFKEN